MNKIIMRFVALLTIVFAMVVGLNANASTIGSQSGVLTSVKKNSMVVDRSDASPVMVKHHKGKKFKGKKFKYRKYRGRKYRGGKWRHKRYRGRRGRRHRHRHYHGYYYPRYGYNSCYRERRRCARRYGWHTYRWRRCVRWHGCSYRGPRVRLDPFLFPFPY